jgi:23S rRNA (pseudouridine1915-N3)-methyltransferase
MRLSIIAVGKIKEPGIRQVIDEYFDRVRRHYSIDEVELREAPAPQQVQAFEKHLPSAAHWVALDSRGTERNSAAFASWLGQRLAQGKGSVAFLLGGAEGLPPPVMSRAHETLSFSKMTFSHRLARLILAEQLYRATAILHNEPYARL